ncbi:PD-(D/E)XK nuclease family transposase [Thiorhodovibrio winogradskyi]|uniref:PD-(D/E)XK nuclease family transposase n=1 Tax=Thiorhodovibrio winogradskyi TaxID=77007 RepID=A0ABZ0S8J0_9GAMM|nr:Rpn family recombination-promoting nuclease/putative transposase [Thiorhodovibrio winogradskyi]
MKHPIDPKIDCVFKALLGAESNRALLIHFLNAILGSALATPITEVELLNPYNEKEYLNDKLSIVDVKARDQRGGLHQVEIQLLTHPDLPARILYNWTDLYSAQLSDGEKYNLLRPTHGIWLLGEDLLPERAEWMHEFRLRDSLGRLLLDHGGIWLLELNKFHADSIQTEQERWLKFFKDGEQLDADALPPWMQTKEMKQAMSTLKAFSDKERAYHAYQARLEFLREQHSIQSYLAELRAEAEQERDKAKQERANAEQERDKAKQERANAEQERRAKETALAELAQLKARLRDQGFTE